MTNSESLAVGKKRILQGFRFPLGQHMLITVKMGCNKEGIVLIEVIIVPLICVS